MDEVVTVPSVWKCSRTSCKTELAEDYEFKLCPRCRALGRTYMRNFYDRQKAGVIVRPRRGWRRVKEELAAAKLEEIRKTNEELESLPKTDEFLAACDRYRQACERDMVTSKELVRRGELVRCVVDDFDRERAVGKWEPHKYTLLMRVKGRADDPAETVPEDRSPADRQVGGPLYPGRRHGSGQSPTYDGESPNPAGVEEDREFGDRVPDLRLGRDPSHGNRNIPTRGEEGLQNHLLGQDDNRVL